MHYPPVPRSTYVPHPFQIVQSENTIMVACEFASASRISRKNTTQKSPRLSWMGWSVGRWEGQTLAELKTLTEKIIDRAGITIFNNFVQMVLDAKGNPQSLLAQRGHDGQPRPTLDGRARLRP